MSVLESSNSADGSLAGEESGSEFARWRGLLRLTLGMLLGPVVALINQQLIYVADDWACGHGMRAAVHVVPILCLVVTIGTAVVAYRAWRAVGAGVEDEQATVAARTRFMSLCGMLISVFSSLVILAQWAAVFVFAPCMRA